MSRRNVMLSRIVVCMDGEYNVEEDCGVEAEQGAR